MKEEWKKVKLGEICKIGDGAHASLKRQNNGILYLTAKNITSLGLDLSKVEYIDEKTYEKHFSEKSTTVTCPKKGDILYSIIGSIGGCYLIKDDKEKIGISSSVAIFRPIKDVIDEKYLFYFLKSELFQQNVNAVKTGAAQGFMSLGRLSLVEISYPKSLPTQQKIASILSAYDDLIENNRRQIKLLEEAALKLYKEWFVKLNFPGHETTKIADGVPDGWKKGTLNEFGTIITGKTPSTKNENYYGGDIPFVKIPDMHKGIFTIKTEEYLTIEGANTQKNKFIPSESLIVSCIGTAGLVNIAYEECQTNQQINSIVCTKKENVYYLYYFLKSQKEYLNALGSNGATMVNVNKEKFGNVEVLIPNDKILERFAVITKPFFDKIKNCQLSIVNLQSARDKLLPKLMNGEIEV